jgi:hypothetical protein
MELGTTLIGTICVAICAMPFILTTRNKNKLIKKQLTALKNLANKNNSEISQFDVYTFYAIGIDKNKNIISFISKNENTNEEQSVNLENIQSCKIETINTPKKAKDIDKLYLKLTHKDISKASILLDFFNSDVNYQLGEELQSINKWNTLINNSLNSNL